MNRKLLMGLTLAGVAGSGGVAFASVATPNDVPTGTELPIESSAVATTAAPTTSTETVSSVQAPHGITYQVGDAGTVTLEVDAGVLTSRQIQPADGWTVTTMSSSGAHTEVHFASPSRLVGFVADLVGNDVVVSLTNDLAPGSTEPAPSPITVSIAGAPAPSYNDDSRRTSPPTAAVPAPREPTTSPATTPPETSPRTTTPRAAAPAPTAPKPAATSSTSVVTSGSSTYDDHEHESDHEDHSYQSESGSDD